MRLKTLKYTYHDEYFFFGFEILYKCESKFEKRNFDHFFFDKKIIKFEKN